MVGVRTSANSSKVTIFGHGLRIAEAFEIEPSVWITPDIPELDLSTTVEGCPSFIDYAAAIHGHPLTSFCVQVREPLGGRDLAIRAWNSLWLFHLFSVASGAPCLMLYAMSDGEKPSYSAASPTPIVRPLTDIVELTRERLIWAKGHKTAFDALIHVPEFSSAMMCYANSFYLPDTSVSLMLLWAGIEGLLSVDAELSRRLALYSAVMLRGSAEEKAKFYDLVKAAYGIRSRAVHGGKLQPDKLAKGSRDAAYILITLLARCVELGRVPPPAEFDRLAVMANVT